MFDKAVAYPTINGVGCVATIFHIPIYQSINKYSLAMKDNVTGIFNL